MTSDSTNAPKPILVEGYVWITPVGTRDRCLQADLPRASGTPGTVELRERAAVESQLWRFDGQRFVSFLKSGSDQMALSREGDALGLTSIKPDAEPRQFWRLGLGGALTTPDGQSALTVVVPPGGPSALKMTPTKNPAGADQLWALVKYEPYLDLRGNQLPSHGGGMQFTLSNRARRGYVLASTEGQEVRMRPDTTKPVESTLWTYKDDGVFNVKTGLALSTDGATVTTAGWTGKSPQWWYLNAEGFLINANSEHLVQLQPGTVEADRRPDLVPFTPLRPLSQSWSVKRFRT